MNFLLLVMLAAMAPAAPLLARDAVFYVGTYTNNTPSHGIYLGHIDLDTGKLGPLTLAARAENPCFLALSPDGKFLYAAVVANGVGSVESFRVEADGSLTVLNQQPCGGAGPCHVCVDATGRDVLVANYGGGSIACFQTLPDGSLTPRTAFVQYTGSGPDPSRQKEPHAHSVYTDAGNRFVYSCDLGTDKVYIFRFDADKGTLTFGNGVSGKVPAGSGPRHLAFDPAGRFAYVDNEMGLSVTAFARDADTGALTALQTIPTLPEGSPVAGATTAEIVCHTSGKWLYVSTRGPDCLTVFSIASPRSDTDAAAPLHRGAAPAADGKLSFIENVSAGVKVPRGFGIDPTGKWLIAGGQQDNRIAVLKIDPATGKLTATGQDASVGAPVCIVFSPVK